MASVSLLYDVCNDIVADGLIHDFNQQEDLAFIKLCSVYRMRTGKELEESDFISFGLKNEDGILTNGVLLADDSPLQHSRL